VTALRLRAGLFAVVAVAVVVITGCSSPFSSNAEPTPTSAQPTGSDTHPAGARLAPSPGLQPFYDQQVAWTSCGDQLECAQIDVPLDYLHPSAGTVHLALYKHLASGDRKGTLLFNPGGPGVSGLKYISAADVVFTQPVVDAFDIVGFDPRGVGSSTAIHCLSAPQLDRLIASDPSPDTRAEEVRALALAKNLAHGCERNSGPLMPHVGTPDAARDMDVIRAVLDEPRLDYFGASYGTFLGATYADLFPQRVGQMVLDGAVAPEVSGVQMGLGQAKGFEGALDSFLADCVQRNDCPVGPDAATARQQVANLLDRTDSTPLPTASGRTLTQGLAFLGIIYPLYDKQNGWPMLRAGLDQAINNNDGTALLASADAYAGRQPNGTYADNSNEAFLAINCLDRPVHASLAQLRHQAALFARQAPIFGSALAWGNVACTVWPDSAARPPHKLHAKGSGPIVVIGTTRDPATPYQWAVDLAHQLDNGVLITRDGDGHTGYNAGNSCVNQAVEQYLINDVVPKNGLSC
jgi:pimeloyl-ACP methyl ester carboxylesterase